MEESETPRPAVDRRRLRAELRRARTLSETQTEVAASLCWSKSRFTRGAGACVEVVSPGRAVLSCNSARRVGDTGRRGCAARIPGSGRRMFANLDRISGCA